MGISLGTVNPGNLTMGTPNQNITMGSVNPGNLTMGTSPTDLSAGWATSGGSAPAPAPTQNAAAVAAAQHAAAARVAANPILASLGTLDGVLNNKLTQAQQTHDQFINKYNDLDAQDHDQLNSQTEQNNSNLASNDMAALLNAAHGGQGLRAVLASLGALSGSGENILHRLVGEAANSDANAAHQTFSTNATSLNEAGKAMDSAEKNRRVDADSALFNDQQDARANVLNSRKGLYDQLANLYGTGTAEGDDYAGKSAALAPEIANTTKASVAAYQPASSLYSPQSLATYLAGTKNLSVNTSGGPETPSTPLNSPLFPSGQKKDQLPGVA